MNPIFMMPPSLSKRVVLLVFPIEKPCSARPSGRIANRFDYITPGC
jgi:hypothetical protein